MEKLARFGTSNPTFTDIQSAFCQKIRSYDPCMISMSRTATAVLATACIHPLSLSMPAQAVQTAQQRARIHVYGLYSYAHGDYGSPSNGSGIALGGNFDGVRLLPYTDVGLEIRGSTMRSDYTNQSSITVGPRISFSRYRLQPYAEYMFGLGRGTFNRTTDTDYTRDYSAIRSYGGGFSFRLTRDFGLQADVQRQRWRYTYMLPYFHPVQASVGISYRVHLHSRTGPQ